MKSQQRLPEIEYHVEYHSLQVQNSEHISTNLPQGSDLLSHSVEPGSGHPSRLQAKSQICKRLHIMGVSETTQPVKTNLGPCQQKNKMASP